MTIKIETSDVLTVTTLKNGQVIGKEVLTNAGSDQQKSQGKVRAGSW